MSLVDAIRRPEYTGERRCWPCTYLNAAIVLVAAAGAAVLWVPLAPLVIAGGAALIALRGYVVPGTPAYGPVVADYLPVAFRHPPGTGADAGEPTVDRDGHRADGGPASSDRDREREREPGSLAAADADGEQVLDALVDAGIVVPDDGGEGELRLDDAFADEWTAEMARLRDLDAPALAAAVADAAPVDVTGRTEDDWVVLSGTGESTWLPRVQAIADAAAVRAMARTSVPEALRARAAEPLRLFVPECPTTGGAVVETTLSACCGGTMGVYQSPEQTVLACEDTEEVVIALD